jgi:hypothetical protein
VSRWIKVAYKPYSLFQVFRNLQRLSFPVPVFHFHVQGAVVVNHLYVSVRCTITSRAAVGSWQLAELFLVWIRRWNSRRTAETQARNSRQQTSSSKPAISNEQTVRILITSYQHECSYFHPLPSKRSLSSCDQIICIKRHRRNVNAPPKKLHGTHGRYDVTAMFQCRPASIVSIEINK